MVASIYRKYLHFGSFGSIKTTLLGQVMNIASNDINRFFIASFAVPYLLWVPLEAITMLLVGLQIFVPAFVAGYVLLFVFIPPLFYLRKRFGGLQSKLRL